MTDAPPRAPRQPKLRSSCDDCGAAKLKCDRVRPHCGRCVSLGLVCVYGVSRKMGKPPRERLRILEGSGVPRTPGDHENRTRNDNCTNGNGIDASVLPSGPFPNINNVSSAWGTVDGYLSSLMTSVDAPDASHAHPLGCSLHDFPSLEFGDDLLPTSALPGLDGYPTSAAQTKHSQNQVDESLNFDHAMMPPAAGKGHDCAREAYDILGSLSFLRLDKVRCTCQPASSPASMTAETADRLPLDQVLHFNREVSERLGHLLTCPCARSPHLALLYASIISRILIWYQQAAGYSESASWSPTNMTLDTASHHGSLTESLAKSRTGSRAGSWTWSNTAASTFSTGSAISASSLEISNGLAVTPAKMAIGTFHVDDLRVQAALKIQLLSGEMRRVGHLIDQFTSLNSSGHGLADEYAFGGVDNLFQNLESWLRDGHSRIINMMRSKLRELNA